MLKLVGTNKNGMVTDERILITDNDKPTAFLIGLAAIELACDISLAIILGRTLFRKKK